jgi:hypothetical protein
MKTIGRRYCMKRSSQKDVRVFCTECGETLDEFWLDKSSTDVKGIIQRMAQCKAEGRFHGHFCSRLWIAGEGSPAKQRKPVKSSPRKIASLKESITRRIRTEEARSGRRAKK